MLTLKIEGFGETIVERKLTRFAENLEAPTGALEDIGTLLRQDVELQFDTEGGHASGGWKALSEGRVRFKANHGLDPRILRATGALFDSLTKKYDPAHIERLGPSSLTFGSTIFYGVYHQSSRPRTKIPYRPMIALTDTDKRNIVKTLQRAMLQGSHEKAVWGA